MNRFLKFEDNTTKENTTRIVIVHSLLSKDVVGVIKWFKYLDCYAFFPSHKKKLAFNFGTLDELRSEVDRIQRRHEDADKPYKTPIRKTESTLKHHQV